jgi:hypothetical protein
MLAPLHGVGIAVAFAVPWLVLDRGADGNFAVASLSFAGGGAMAAAAALVLLRWMSRRSPALRFAAAFATLLLGTALAASVLMMLQAVFARHELDGIPLRFAPLVFAISGAGALYNVISVASRLMLPLGLPVTLAVAALMARRADRVEESAVSAMPPASGTELR